ncbi:thioester domain-containing protein [Haloechinothrix halophila]|uniref:thioester domain-containing protein n=1 Tax=Haloechinothrix halophila TaxID=1069073 RepID=UPI00041A6A07|nr:thioester domain-containing protein [Haloechinothrix halophila]
MRTRSVLTRAGAVAIGATFALLSTAAPASADDATGTVLGPRHNISGYKVNMDSMTNLNTALFGLKLDGGNTLRMYCVEIKVDLRHGETMVETPWDQYPNPDSPFHDNRGKIQWVLQNGYPSVDTDALEEAIGADTLTDGLSEKEAITGTQAAVWRFSDDEELQRPNATQAGDDADQDVLALYDYLTSEARDIEEPTPTLELAPETASGQAGERIGPFTVATTGEVSELTTDLPEGTTLTDADGKELSASDITDGSEIYVDVPASMSANNASFEIKATGHVNTGRLFVAGNYDERKAQSLIVAQSEDVTLSAGATATWQAAPTTTPPEETTSSTPAPTTSSSAPTTSTTSAAPPAPTTTEAPPAPVSNEDDLALTGASIMTPLLVGVGLVIAGVGALMFQRRRKNSTS